MPSGPTLCNSPLGCGGQASSTVTAPTTTTTAAARTATTTATTAAGPAATTITTTKTASQTAAVAVASARPRARQPSEQHWLGQPPGSGQWPRSATRLQPQPSPPTRPKPPPLPTMQPPPPLPPQRLPPSKAPSKATSLSPGHAWTQLVHPARLSLSGPPFFRCKPCGGPRDRTGAGPRVTPGSHPLGVGGLPLDSGVQKVTHEAPSHGWCLGPKWALPRGPPCREREREREKEPRVRRLDARPGNKRGRAVESSDSLLLADKLTTSLLHFTSRPCCPL